MLRFIAYHLGFTPTSLIASAAIHGTAIIALLGFGLIPIASPTASLSPDLEPQVFEIAFGPLPEPVTQVVEQSENSAETIAETINKEKPVKENNEKLIPKVVKKNTKTTTETNVTRDQVEKGNNTSAHSNTVSSEKSPLTSPQQLMNLSSWINRHRFYPSDARRKGEEGTVLLRISFSNKGDLETYQVIRSSGSSALDRAATEILKRSAPYPEELVASFSHAEVPLVFSLRS
jgi:periplasmic protein TonB